MNEDNDNILYQMLSAIYISQVRIYDLLLVIGDKLGADTMSVKELHELGKTFSPEPYLEDESEDDEEN